MAQGAVWAVGIEVCFVCGQDCACRKLHPRCSGGIPVFVQDSAEAVSPAYHQLGDLCVGERCGGVAQGCCLVYRLVGPVGVVVEFELAERVA